MSQPSVRKSRLLPVAIAAARAAEREWCASLMASSDPWITLRRGLASCRRSCRHPQYELFVARGGGRPLGFILLHPRGAMSSPYVASIAVAAEARGKQIGIRLLRFAEKRYTRRARHIFLCVSSFNRRARKLYERLGYRRVANLKDYVLEGASEILMHKRLR